MSRKVWYMITFIALMMLPLAGCSGGSSSTTSQNGTPVSFSGKVAGVEKSTLKTLFAAAADLGTLSIINAQDGSSLGSGAIDSSGAFKNISITLPNVKTVLVFKADVSLAGTPFRSIVPMDLSTPPAAGISANNSVNIAISQDTTNIAITVSAMLGVTGVLGDAGATLNSVSKTFADAATQVVNNGGQVLAYNTSGLALTGSLSNAALLPAADAGTLTAADLNNIALGGDIQSAFIPTTKPIVNFTVTNKATGKGIKGLRTFALHVAKLVPETAGSNSLWQNYISKGLPQTAMPGSASASSNPSTDASDRFNTTTTSPTYGAKIADGYKVIDHGDGSYTVTFGADITVNTNVAYDATATTRLGISIRSVAVPGVVGVTAGAYGGPINPLTNALQATFTSQNTINLIYDFTPSTGAALVDVNGAKTFARDIVTAATCAQCHYKTAFAVPNNGLSGHTGSRTDTKLCVMCHTNQIANGEGEFVTFIHRIHMGEVLNEGGTFKPVTGSLVTYNEQTYPQDIRNCTMCHQGKDVDNWKSKPSRKSCGSCHNAVDFAAGTLHSVQSSDANCNGCHAAGGVSLNHLPIGKPEPLNSLVVYAGAPYNGVFDSYSAAYQAAGRVAPGSPNANTPASYVAAASLSRLPVGAKAISYVVYSSSKTAASNPYIKFKFQSQTADASGVLGAKTDVVFNDPAVKSDLIDGFAGSPSVYFAFGVPQDGVTAPVDYNATVSAYMKRLWNNTAASVGQPTQAGTLVKEAGKSYYTLTLTGVTIPTNAVMLTGGIGYTYGIGNAMTKVSGKYIPFATTTMPLTQTDLAAYPYTVVPSAGIGYGGLSVPADNKWVTAKNYTARRVIVDNAKCNACHGRLGVNPTFHAGQRNDAPTCVFCHNVNRVNNGWGVNTKEFVHSIHAASKRVNKFSWEASAGATYWKVTFPGSNTSNRATLKNCEMCHVAGFYDFSSSVYTANNGSIFDNMLFTTVATTSTAAPTVPSPVPVVVTGTETIPGTYWSPFVTAGANYGAGFVYTASATAGVAATTAAAGTTLVSSPISSACFGCHDTAVARAHMAQNGGSLYVARSAAIGTKEMCIICHGTAGNVANPTVPTIKAVHRWW